MICVVTNSQIQTQQPAGLLSNIEHSIAKQYVHCWYGITLLLGQITASHQWKQLLISYKTYYFWVIDDAAFSSLKSTKNTEDVSHLPEYLWILSIYPGEMAIIRNLLLTTWTLECSQSTDMSMRESKKICPITSSLLLARAHIWNLELSLHYVHEHTTSLLLLQPGDMLVFL